MYDVLDNVHYLCFYVVNSVHADKSLTGPRSLAKFSKILQIFRIPLSFVLTTDAPFSWFQFTRRITKKVCGDVTNLTELSIYKQFSEAYSSLWKAPNFNTPYLILLASVTCGSFVGMTRRIVQEFAKRVGLGPSIHWYITCKDKCKKNPPKDTKLQIRPHTDFHMGNSNLKNVYIFIYLGSVLTNSHNVTKEIQRRVWLASLVFRRLSWTGFSPVRRKTISTRKCVSVLCKSVKGISTNGICATFYRPTMYLF